MTETKKEFSQRIANCNSCKNKYGETPFFFPMYSQKVMLVTGCPSFQAALKPLTSVRFFRVLCLALFGRANISEKAILEFHKGGNIYWTHYHKCYYENFFLDREYKNLPDACYREHFIEELRLLSPQLVIVLGKHIVEKIFRTKLRDNEVRCFEKYGYKFYGTDFPVTGEEERFKEIRKYIQPYINFVKDVDVNSNEDDVPHFVDYERSKHSVHLDFELQALKKHGQNLGILKLDNQRADKIPKSIDELWHEKIILPNLDRYSFAVSCYAFIENQIKTFLFDIFSKQNNDGEVWYVIDRLRERREMNKLRGVNEITFEDVIEEIKWNWLKVLDEYLHYMVKVNGTSHLFLRQSILGKYDRLKKKINGLRKIRNRIVHHNGFINPGEINNFADNNEDFKGIRFFVNMIYIEKKGCNEIFELVEDVCEFIREIEE